MKGLAALSTFLGGRQRDVFPLELPPISESAVFNVSRSVSRRLSRASHKASLLHGAVKSLNELAGLDKGYVTPSVAEQQHQVIEHIKTCIDEFGAPPPDLTEAGAIDALCNSGPSYVEASTRVTHHKEHVSWPNT